MIERILKTLEENGISTNRETIETILNGNGTKADGTIEDLKETLRNYTNESEDFINSI